VSQETPTKHTVQGIVTIVLQPTSKHRDQWDQYVFPNRNQTGADLSGARRSRNVRRICLADVSARHAAKRVTAPTNYEPTTRGTDRVRRRTIYGSLTTASCREQITSADSHAEQFIEVLNGDGASIRRRISCALTEAEQTAANVKSYASSTCIVACVLINYSCYKDNAVKNTRLSDIHNKATFLQQRRLAWINRTCTRNEACPDDCNC